jgi:ketosteroid isomerase-like protein
MSQENVEIVRRFGEAMDRGDHASALRFLAPDVVVTVMQEGAVHGREAVSAMWKRWEAEWEEMEIVTEELLDVGDHVVVTMRESGRGRSSGAKVGARYFSVVTLRDGKIVRAAEYTERSRALEAAGLQE